MRGLTKKIAASVMALTLVFAMATSCFAATWGSYFGASAPEPWNEGADGKLTVDKASGFTASMDSVGWGGVWGAQVYLDSTKKDNAGGVSIKKGQTYTLSFTAKATNITKYVYVKIATGETLAYGTWIKLEPNKNKKVKVKFKAAANANAIYFALGGDYGDRGDVDQDAATRYALFKKVFKVAAEQALEEDAGSDPTAATVITVSKFTLIQVPKVKSAKSKKKGKVTVKFAKIAGASKYKVKVGSKTTTTKKTTVTVKAKSKKKVKVQVAAVAKSSGVASAYSAKKTVKVK